MNEKTELSITEKAELTPISREELAAYCTTMASLVSESNQNLVAKFTELSMQLSDIRDSIKANSAATYAVNTAIKKQCEEYTESWKRLVNKLQDLSVNNKTDVKNTGKYSYLFDRIPDTDEDIKKCQRFVNMVNKYVGVLSDITKKEPKEIRKTILTEMKNDGYDVQKIFEEYKTMNPDSKGVVSMISYSTGLSASIKNRINCMLCDDLINSSNSLRQNTKTRTPCTRLVPDNVKKMVAKMFDIRTGEIPTWAYFCAYNALKRNGVDLKKLKENVCAKLSINKCGTGFAISQDEDVLAKLRELAEKRNI